MNRVYAVSLSSLAPSPSITTFGTIVTVFLKNALVIAGVITLIFLVLGGFSVIMGAGGDAKKMQEGQRTLTTAVVGLVIVVTAYWMIEIIQYITGAKLLP